MEYIRRKIDRKITFLENSGQVDLLKVYYQVRLEYLLIYCLGFLWNKNLSGLSDQDREYILSRIYHPSIGDLEDIARKLDINGDFFLHKRVRQATQKYPKLRNEKIGHGYVFEDGTQDYLTAIQEIYETLLTSEIPIISQNFDLIKVVELTNGFYSGISYKPDGSEFVTWRYPQEVGQLEIGSLYLKDGENNYARMSPFINIESEDEIYIFNSIQEPLLGKVKYNRILSTGNSTKDWPEFIDAQIDIAGLKRKSPNGTILNVFKRNHSKYIDIGIRRTVTDFLLNTSHSVSATIWGHGGVGKTAAIQHICDELSVARNRKFDYIIFLSAKDRLYNYMTGSIQEVTDYVTSCEDVIRNVNKFIFGSDSHLTDGIEKFEGIMLIVIDDYETFADEEKQKIREFVRRLNTNHHRIIVTTRADFKLGDEIQSNELDKSGTAEFFIKVMENEFPQWPLDNWKRKIMQENYSQKLFLITSGRPLFIFQFTHTLIQTGDIDEALNANIKDSISAIDFLYGRIYDYLSSMAQDIFVAISLLVTATDLSNLVSKLIFILNLEADAEKFANAIQELVKLRILEVKENDFFQVYSKEIYQKMSDYFLKREDQFIGICRQRLMLVSRDKKLDNEQALLKNADTSRLTKNEEEVSSTYKYILNRATAPSSVKLQAALNLSSYLFTDRGKKESAVKILDDNYHLFNRDGKYVKMLATYNWSLGTNEGKQKAISYLTIFYANNTNLKDDVNLEILGLLITYRSIYAISQKDELKELLKYQEITQLEFTTRNNALKDEFHNIWKQQAHFFWDFLKRANISRLGSGARQNAVTGLYQFCETQIRINKVETAKEICEFVIEKFPSNFHPLFQSKLNKLKYILERQKVNSRE
nr:hypothetical protein [uncultured Dyadobacter sp.]